MNPTILISVAHYLPGWKFGGQTRSVANLVDHLGDEYSFRIVCADRDFGDDTAFAGITADRWQQVGKAQVLYTSPSMRSLSAFSRILNQTSYDVLYLNSFFNPVFTLQPLIAYRLHLAERQPIILATRGELSMAALQIKATKKKWFIRAARLAGLYKNIRWQASTGLEAEDIRHNLSNIAQDISIAGNLPLYVDQDHPSVISKVEPNAPLRMVFLSRLASMKNLEFALEVLTTCKEGIVFDIWGTIEDRDYWSKCQALIDKMPENICVTYKGGADHDHVSRILGSYDLMFLPSLGENYGHVIAEALSVGTSVLISNRTPWLNLENEGVGWDLPISEGPSLFKAAIADARVRRNKGQASLRNHVRSYAKSVLLKSGTLESNRRMFDFSNSTSAAND